MGLAELFPGDSEVFIRLQAPAEGKAHGELVALIQQAVRLCPQVIVPHAVIHGFKRSRHTVGECKLLIEQHRLCIVLRTHGRQNLTGEQLCRLLEPARGMAQGIPDDFTVQWIRGPVRDAGSLEGGGIEPAGVMVGGDHHHGNIRYGRIHQGRCRARLVKDAVVIAAADDIIGVRVGDPKGTDPFQILLRGIRRAECETENHLRGAGHMGVTFRDAGYDQAGFLFDFGLIVCPGEQIFPAAHGENLTVPDRHGFGKGACPVCRIDPAANDLVRFHSGCLLRWPARTAIPASQISTTAKIRREETTYTWVEIFPRTMP